MRELILRQFVGLINCFGTIRPSRLNLAVCVTNYRIGTLSAELIKFVYKGIRCGNLSELSKVSGPYSFASMLYGYKKIQSPLRNKTSLKIESKKTPPTRNSLITNYCNFIMTPLSVYQCSEWVLNVSKNVQFVIQTSKCFTGHGKSHKLSGGEKNHDLFVIASSVDYSPMVNAFFYQIYGR